MPTPQFVAFPTNPSEGGSVKFDTLEKAIRYCSSAYQLGIRAVIKSLQTGEVLHRNYRQYAEDVPRWV